MATDLQDPGTDHHAPAAQSAAEHVESFAETALKLGGKSDDEARRTGAIDTADDQVEQLFAAQYQTVNSPAHRAVWDRSVPTDEFLSTPPKTPAEVQKVMDDSIAVVSRHKQAGTLLNDEGKTREEVLQELAGVGYWGLLVGKEFGGSDCSFSSFAAFLARMATLDGTIAGLASIHGCIGAVDPVKTFGNADQKQRFLPGLADGSRLSAFALTEPCAGSDLTALRTTAVLDGDSYVVNGEKLFISNVVPGRTIGLVCLVDDKPAVLVVDLPAEENEQFQLKKYGIHALARLYNRGIVFNNFRVPQENLLKPVKGDGLTIAYHGLNLGRVSLCANAAGTMRQMMADMIPWAHFRVTYSEPIAHRELVQRRLGEMAGLIVGCDALVAWCSDLLDRGYRGEMECIIAKIFGSESMKHAAIELYMKTHGGRSFLHGHAFGDNVHDFLAPCIYEGEGEMLGMAFFKSLVKRHGKTYFEPVGKALAAAGIQRPNPLNPAHALKLAPVAMPYLKWLIGRKLMRGSKPNLPGMPSELRGHAEYACEKLTATALEIDGAMQKFQLKLADRQCRMAELSGRCQDLITMLATSMYAARQENEVVRVSADLLCQKLRQKLDGRRPSNQYFKQVTGLGAQVSAGAFPGLEEICGQEILQKYAPPAQ
ncbi:Acyl-CoA dehydrogenase [Posidoniimonas polymericola]|uniref:Acyl-CoA dehydrogenase n=1 Tax=Posidoniimonas polymericola TaxID=2528002 RepID=A0A5C5YER0_9BACT|nr:acyl-CoA dehydrogenase family protein [Posidoniimonas polymericola]TWT73478.1 Acyl-CoA dehydrogenase [Posidoniimonas polymericola]